MELQPIPVPGVLDPDRPRLEGLIDAEDSEQALATMREALREACDYGRTLWNVVDRLRHYLMDVVPDNPREPGPYRVTGRPTGPDDDEGWQQWMDAYAGTTSALAGPHGDSGFGVSEAKREAELRRTASNVRILAEDRPRPGASPDPPVPPDRPVSERLDDRFRAGAIVGAVAAIVTMDLLSRLGRRGRRRRSGPGPA